MFEDIASLTKEILLFEDIFVWFSCVDLNVDVLYIYIGVDKMLRVFVTNKNLWYVVKEYSILRDCRRPCHFY